MHEYTPYNHATTLQLLDQFTRAYLQNYSDCLENIINMSQKL